jgi:hypothetical protein
LWPPLIDTTSIACTPCWCSRPLGSGWAGRLRDSKGSRIKIWG